MQPCNGNCFWAQKIKSDFWLVFLARAELFFFYAANTYVIYQLLNDCRYEENSNIILLIYKYSRHHYHLQGLNQGWFRSQSLEPVSYTHLDVYKRQL